MERAKPYLRVAAVVSAVALVGAFVAYRAGAFSSPPPAEPQPEPTTPPQAEPPTPESPTAPSADDKSKWIMYGSKSAPVYIQLPPGAAPENTQQQPAPPTATPAPNSPTPQPPVFLGGSKSIIIHEPQKPSPNPVFMGGSKFKAIIGPGELPKPSPPPMPEPRKP